MNDDPNTLYPTHTCFDDAIEFLWALAKAKSEAERLFDMRLVHAICQQKGGPLFAHAWVEDSKNDLVYFQAIYRGEKIYVEATKEEFAETLTVHEATRYTVFEVERENHRSGTYGPWLPQYLELARQQDAAASLSASSE